MKVLVQEWRTWYRGTSAVSISKDCTQLDETIARLVPERDPGDREIILNEREAAEPDGDAYEINIPNSSVFTEMVQSRTVFLEPDEMYIVWDNN